QKDLLASRLIESINTATIADRDQINSILTRSAARNLTDLELQARFSNG
ncbi:MAG: hypothetical protein H7318_20805, partial [Oligoflexus sp.]|nr:hypothetical protein [Oligoflexus sp.]